MTNPRKILILTNRIPYPLKDGGNLAMNAMIEGYHRSGWQVYLLSMNTSRHHIKEEQLKTLYTHIYNFEWVDVNNHLKWTTILKNYLFSTEPEHAIRFYNEDYRSKLKEILKTFKPDVIQVESVYLSTYLPVINKYSDAVTVLRVHNIEYQVWLGLSKRSKSWYKRIYLSDLSKRVRHFERRAWKKYDLLLAITEKDARQIERLESVNNLIVAPFSIDLEKINTGNNERWVGYHIGAMDWMPNREGIQWFLEKAWPKIHKAAPEFEFYFAGRNMPEALKKIDTKGVYCLDEVPSAEDFIADKKILIVPIWSGGGIRVKILEAMAAGKVVITTPVGIKGIEASEYEHYLLAKKTEDFAKSIKWCLDNKEAAKKMAGNAHMLIKEKYENGKVIRDVIEEVERLLKERE